MIRLSNKPCFKSSINFFHSTAKPRLVVVADNEVATGCDEADAGNFARNRSDRERFRWSRIARINSTRSCCTQFKKEEWGIKNGANNTALDRSTYMRPMRPLRGNDPPRVFQPNQCLALGHRRRRARSGTARAPQGAQTGIVCHQGNGS